MNKSKYILIILLLIVIIGAIIYFYVTNNNSANEEQYNNEYNNEISANVESQNNEIAESKQTTETQISSYSTQIKDNSAGRLTNIRLTCGIINNTVINPNETFSFNEIVGKPTAERGYQEAKIIIDHKTETGIGGGNCQVSSTLYNAVLAIPTLTVVERHEHGKDVTYVPEGKDAAVSYGSLDFKFKNTNDYKVKINIATDDKTITATIVKIED